MAPDFNPLHPSVVLPVDGLVHQLDEVALCDGVVLRNLDASELDRINGMIGEASWFGMEPFDPEVVCIEASIRGKEYETESPEAHQDKVAEVGMPLAEKAISIIRLAQAGPVAARLIIWHTIPSAYTLSHIGYLPGIIRKGYPREYRLDASLLVTLQHLFTLYWKKDIQGMPGVRWLNKSQAELDEHDRFVHLVFGLEQVLLRGESERSYLSYKMALRAAWILGADADERSTIFCDMRKGYGIRSRIAHGLLSRALTEEEDALATTLEGYLRRLATMCLDESARFDSPWLDQVVLGGIRSTDDHPAPN